MSLSLFLVLRSFVPPIASPVKRLISWGQLCAMSSSADGKSGRWSKCDDGAPVPQLRLYNSLTRTKEEFIPLNGRNVLWYSCGPTVYDASHMGHARSYISFDILRRVLVNYFNYEVLYVMNITDIDDKIIRRARRQHLFNNYSGEKRDYSDLISDVSSAIECFRAVAESEKDLDKKLMLKNTLAAGEKVLAEFEADSTHEKVSDLIRSVKDPLSSWLDNKFGHSVTDHSIFSSLTRHWEEEYHKDMAALNVMPADVLTRVSEYVPEVVSYVQKIIENGYGYESNGSVYFDVNKFSSSPDHQYGKLVPEAVKNSLEYSLAFAEGEGVLSASAEKQREKKSPQDFALWKVSKAGEPSWESPWGYGRPGWHIECSVMACDILGGKIDIHTGGVDLKFPHHDNEIAQAEACYGHDQWVSYFLHSGHLTIEGCKMSKSLKNFITIKTALEKYNWRQIRLMFLLHPWGATMDFSTQTMEVALHWEKMFNEFFLKVKDLVRHCRSGAHVDGYSKFDAKAKELNKVFYDTQTAVHNALCDSIDTHSAMKHLRDLISACNIYMENPVLNAQLLENIGLYLTRMLQIFGAVPSFSGLGFPVESQELDIESAVVPYASLVAEFREEVRQVSLQDKNQKLLVLCDELRDQKLPDLGVLLEDKDGRTVVKYVGKELAMREREKQAQDLAEKQRIKGEQKRKQEDSKRAREAAAAVPPHDMFRNQTDKYSQFDEQGIPTHDMQGVPITDSQRKKLRKQWKTQEKKYSEHLSKLN